MRKLKIAFAYGPWSIGTRVIDVPNIWTSPRGLTGSELSFFSFAREMHKRGHDVHVFMHGVPEQIWEGMKIWPFDWFQDHMNTSWDVAYSWLEVEPLRCVPHPVLRMVNQQVNDFQYCKADFDDLVDVYTSPSDSHREHIKKLTASPHKWEVIPNGCDPSQYSAGSKVPGRVIWASSPDRGLHLLLQAWPAIRRAVPEAHLRIFYNMDNWLNTFVNLYEHPNWDFHEYACRARYVDMALRRMSSMGIQKFGSIGRKQMVDEMDQASVLAYPCDTVWFTEGFSVTTMEACASGTVPIISSVDSLGQIYGKAVPMVPAPAREHMKEFTELVIRALRDDQFKKEVLEKTKAIAQEYTWPILAERLEKLMLSKVKT